LPVERRLNYFRRVETEHWSEPIGKFASAEFTALSQDITVVEAFVQIRERCEELSDGGHALRIALAKLQTLSLVRIIEGHA
jgi:hypothetical protein